EEVQERSGGQRQQRQGPVVAAREMGLAGFWLASPDRVEADRVEADRVAGHGSANPAGGERSGDGGVDRERRAAQRPVDRDGASAAQPARSGIDRGIERLGPDVAGDRAMVEEG